LELSKAVILESDCEGKKEDREGGICVCGVVRGGNDGTEEPDWLGKLLGKGIPNGGN
jgi:hypothetical protein